MRSEIKAGEGRWNAHQPGIGRLAAWVIRKLGAGTRQRPSLIVRERITLAPRQTLSLVEAEGRRFLIASSSEGTPTFYALDEPRKSRPVETRNRTPRAAW